MQGYCNVKVRREVLQLKWGNQIQPFHLHPFSKGRRRSLLAPSLSHSQRRGKCKLARCRCCRPPPATAEGRSAQHEKTNHVAVLRAHPCTSLSQGIRAHVQNQRPTGSCTHPLIRVFGLRRPLKAHTCSLTTCKQSKPDVPLKQPAG